MQSDTERNLHVCTLCIMIWYDCNNHKECSLPLLLLFIPYSHFIYLRPFSYHVSVVNGFSQSIYYSLTLISRHLSMTNTKLFLGRPDLLFCLIICIRDVLFVHYDRRCAGNNGFFVMKWYDLMVCNYVALLDTTFYNSNVGNLKIR